MPARPPVFQIMVIYRVEFVVCFWGFLFIFACDLDLYLLGLLLLGVDVECKIYRFNKMP